MVKRFLLMLALAFVLQVSWGAASAYCMHETGKASEHFGHHQHRHHGSNAAGDVDNTSFPKKAAAHADCASCSHSSLIAFSLSAQCVQPSLSNHALSTPRPGQPTPYLGLPERPRWTVAA